MNLSTSRVGHVVAGSWPARLVVAGLAVKLVAWLAAYVLSPSRAEAVDTMATLLLLGGAGSFLIQALRLASRRLLWRVRRKLIISYIFIGFVPAILIAIFFLLGGLLLFSNFSSYLVQSRLTALTDRARAIATAAAADIRRNAGRDMARVLQRHRDSQVADYPGVSLAVVPLERDCGSRSAARRLEPGGTALAGPWDHVDPPQSVPAWISCDGFSGLLAYRVPGSSAASRDAPAVVAQGPPLEPATPLARSIVVPDPSEFGWAVVVDLPVNDAERRWVRSETGVEVTGTWRLPSGAEPLTGRPVFGLAAERETTVAERLPFPSILFVEFRDWATGVSGRLSIVMQISVGEIYNRISAAQGSIGDRSLGQGLLIALVVIGVLFLVIETMALIAGLALARSITRSVHGLFLGTERVQRADFTYKIAVTAQDQLGELARSFNSMTSSIEDLLRQAAEKKRLEEELRIAHEIQMSLLPQGDLQMPGVTVTALCVPAREVGGDYYDFLPLGARRLGVLIADVSGKGTSAALYMAELKGLVLSLGRIHSSPRELLIDANRIIGEHLDSRSFITMTYAVVDLDARTITYARAGHTPIIYLPGQPQLAGGVQILVPDGLVLGLKIDDGQLFERLLEEQTLPIRPGDLYLFFTDGITEAMNASDDCFGEQRLGRLVEDHAHLPPDELREQVLREVASFVDGAPQHDDMTMILLRIDDWPVRAEPSRASASEAEEVAEIQ